jgi:hypothetical protein
MTLGQLEFLFDKKRIDRSAQYQHSERGFNESMRVASDRPSRIEQWSAGMYVSFQRVQTDGLTYSQRVASTLPLPKPRASFCVFTGVGLVEITVKRKPRAPRKRVGPDTRTVSEIIFGW